MLWLRAMSSVAVLPGLVAGLVPWWLARTGWAAVSIGVARWFGVLPLTLGLAGLAWCVHDFATAGRGTLAPWDAPRHLVVRGLYRRSRNPMYVSVLLVLAGEALLAESAAIAVWTVTTSVAFHLRVVLYEEPRLAELFGDSFEDYRARVPRWWGRGSSERRP